MRFIALVLVCLFSLVAPALAQEPASSTKKADKPVGRIQNSVIMLQSEIGGVLKTGTAVAVKTGPTCLALTSYEAVKGAKTINALVPGHGLVMASLVKFAPEANLALLEVSAADVPSMPLGDFQLLRPQAPVEMTTAIPIREGNAVTAMNPLTRQGVVQNVIPRPTGAIIRVTFTPGIDDPSTGAPVITPNSGEVVGIALSAEASQVDSLRFVIPTALAGALSPELAQSNGSTAAIRVVDGSQAPVLAGDAAVKESSEWMGYVGAIVGAAIVVGIVAVVILKKKKHVIPFSNLPQLPEGVMCAFVDAEGRLLPMDLEVIKVGRAQDNDWHFNDPSVSNYHARIKRLKGGAWEVSDLRSTNGTFVRNRRIGSEETIPPGTIVKFGKTIQVMLMTRNQAT